MNDEDNMRQRTIDGLLREAHRHSPGADEAFVHRTLAELGQPLSWKKPAIYLTTLAASIAVMVSLFIRQPDADTEPSIAGPTLESSFGKILIDGEIPTSSFVVLPCEIICQEGSGGTLRYPDGTKVELLSGSYRFSSGTNEQKKLYVQTGRAFCSVKPQPRSAPLLFSTPHAEGEVLGTVFQISTEPKSTRLQTLLGRVQVRKPSGSGVWIPVEAGHYVEVPEHDSIASRTMETNHLQSGDIIWMQEFGNEYGPDADLEGTQEELHEDGVSRWVMKSRFNNDGPPPKPNGWDPDQWIGLERNSKKGLFPALEDMEIHLRVKADRAGYFQVALQPTDRLLRNEHVLSFEISSPLQWQEIVLTLKDFTRFRNSRMPHRGMQISAIALWGFESGHLYLDRILVRRSLPLN